MILASQFALDASAATITEANILANVTLQASLKARSLPWMLIQVEPVQCNTAMMIC